MRTCSCSQFLTLKSLIYWIPVEEHSLFRGINAVQLFGKLTECAFTSGHAEFDLLPSLNFLMWSKNNKTVSRSKYLFANYSYFFIQVVWICIDIEYYDTVQKLVFEMQETNLSVDYWLTLDQLHLAGKFV
jgi:hypothetical protein